MHREVSKIEPEDEENQIAAIETPYSGLTPELVLNAVESKGFRPTGGMLALNSYENRVYQIALEDRDPLVAKFYRPGRWSDDAIGEEHRFTLALAEIEIPVVPPIRDEDGETLFHYGNFRFSLCPRQGGRWPNLEDPEHRAWLGRLMGRIHQAGAARLFRHRPRLGTERFGYGPVRYLIDRHVVPENLVADYENLSAELLGKIDRIFQTTGPVQMLRLHGDCHPGNILWTEAGPHFVDFDDCINGPALQDLWMLLSGDAEEMVVQLTDLLEGYRMFRPFDLRELHLIEPLRTLRMIHYAGWLAQRWRDPAFPAAFTWFGTQQYWQQHIATLEQQLSALEQPPLPVF